MSEVGWERPTTNSRSDTSACTCTAGCRAHGTSRASSFTQPHAESAGSAVTVPSSAALPWPNDLKALGPLWCGPTALFLPAEPGHKPWSSHQLDEPT